MVDYKSSTIIGRPANTTAYTAQDVVGGPLDLGILGQAGDVIEVNSTRFMLSISAIPAGMSSFTLYLYTISPPSATADNGAWGLPAGDRDYFLGGIDLGTPVLMPGTAATCYIEVSGLTKKAKLIGQHLFGYLVTVGGFTPAANSEVYNLTVYTRSA